MSSKVIIRTGRRIRNAGLVSVTTIPEPSVREIREIPPPRRKKPPKLKKRKPKPGDFPVSNAPFDWALYEEELKKKQHLVDWAYHGGKASRKPLPIRPSVVDKIRKAMEANDRSVASPSSRSRPSPRRP